MLEHLTTTSDLKFGDQQAAPASAAAAAAAAASAAVGLEHEHARSAKPANSSNTPQRRLEAFYKHKNLFITGATGFVGKSCLIKLLSSFDDIGTVYVLMRNKKGMTAQQRFNRMLNESPFSTRFERLDCNGDPKFPEIGIQMQNEWVDAAKRMKQLDWTKVKPIEGDMSLAGLGLSEQVRAELCARVDVVFNIAASVAFDAPLKQNLRDNYMGTSNLLELTKGFSRLVSFVHVSTFFSNHHKAHIEERVLEMERDCEKMADLIKWLPDSVCKQLENSQFMENRPNTYIYTKAMTEDYIQKFQGQLPIAIVRPSIVTPGSVEPVPGWVDNVNGPMGLGALASVGILRTIDWNYDGVADFIPVDFVANSMIAIAERTARLYPNEIKVYNCSSSSLKPITWGQTFEVLRAESFKSPPLKMIRVPIKVPKYKRANPMLFNMLKISELLFAYFIDLILVLCGQKSILVKLTKKLHHGYDILKPFTTKQYTCSNDNLLEALNDLDPFEREQFDFDIARLDMMHYFRRIYYACRLGILKEDITNVQAARMRMRLLIFVSFLFQLMLYSMLAWLGYKLVCELNLVRQL